MLMRTCACCGKEDECISDGVLFICKKCVKDVYGPDSHLLRQFEGG